MRFHAPNKPGGECFAALLGIIQITLQALMASLMYVYDGFCFATIKALTSLIFALAYTDVEREPPEEFAKLVTVGKVCLTHFILSVGLSFYVFFYDIRYIAFVANVMGLLGAILAILQYFPQIYTTYSLKHAGSLSIPMMCLQTPGGFILTASLAAREGTTWSSWLPYLTAAVLQGIVLVLAVYYETRNKSETDIPTEQTPLIID
jgi:uncharacterized protein with PQ loop repeat